IDLRTTFWCAESTRIRCPIRFPATRQQELDRRDRRFGRRIKKGVVVLEAIYLQLARGSWAAAGEQGARPWFGYNDFRNLRRIRPAAYPTQLFPNSNRC